MSVVDGARTFDSILRTLKIWFPQYPRDTVVVVRISEQRLYLLEAGEVAHSYPVSTSRYGIGNRQDSYRTPLGVHRIADKIGDGVPPGTIFKRRKSKGEIAEILRGDVAGQHDFVTSRILWLTGLEPGVNRGPGIDSHDRFIYIHGTHAEGRIGQPASYGCVRMTNRDVIELYGRLVVDNLVVIVE